MNKPKQVCQFCEKKFKRVKGHYAFCKVRNAPPQSPAQPVNTTSLSPRAALVFAANKAFEALYDHEKLMALALLEANSRGPF